MKDWNSAIIKQLLCEAAMIALKYYQNPSVEFKADRSLVTQADKAIEAFFAEIFDKPADGSFMIGEETISTHSPEYFEAAMGGVAWILDPIDGTASYAHSTPIWGISLARMEKGVLTDGALFMPIFGDMMITDGHEVYHSVKGSDPANWDFSKMPLLNIKIPAVNDGGLISISQKMAKQGGFKGRNPVQALCCCVYSMAYLITGGYMGYIATAKLWDIAGGVAIMSRHGLDARLISGPPLGVEVTEDVYNLDFTSPNCWSLKGHSVMSRTPEATKYVIENTILPPNMK